jgi:hypothetical protein
VPQTPPKSSVGLVVLGVGLGMLALAVIGVGVGYVVLQDHEPPTTTAIKPKEDASLATTAPDTEPDDEPALVPSGSGSPKAPLGAVGQAQRRGGPRRERVSDAALVAIFTRFLRRERSDLPPRDTRDEPHERGHGPVRHGRK